MSNWMGTGYDGLDKVYEEMGGKSGPRRVWIRPNTTARYMFLDDLPSRFWEHQFYFNGNWRNWEPCVVRNKIGPSCPICDASDKNYPYFVGLHTVISMTPWFTKKVQEVCFSREIYAARLGGDEKPGVLKKLKKLSEKYGRLRGLVFDIERPGKKTEVCGTEFELIEQIDPKGIREYATEQLKTYMARVNGAATPDKQVTMENLWKRNPWEPHDFEKLIKPRTYDELKTMFARGGGAPSGEAADEAEPADDQMPY
jgi:hypothetical protein